MTRAHRTNVAAGRVPSGAATFVGALALAGCATGVPDYMPDADEGSRHAVVIVERSHVVSDSEPTTAEAFAQFARVPASDEPARVLHATGMLRHLPAAGECELLDQGTITTPLTSIGRIELLDVGQVTIQVGGETTALGAHAFPTVSDFVSGVVYATRTRDAQPLPADAPYSLQVAGSTEVPPLSMEADAPATLESVTVGGVPIEEASRVVSGDPLDLTWGVGEPLDLVYVELLSHDEAAGIVCAFNDSEGVGTVPTSQIPALDTDVRLSVHRLRVAELQNAAFDSGEVRFDFEVSANLAVE